MGSAGCVRPVSGGSRIRIGLNVRVGQWVTKTDIDRIELRGLKLSPSQNDKKRAKTNSERLVESQRKEVSDGHVDGLLVQIMFQNDKTSVERGLETKDLLERGVRRKASGSPTGDLPI